MKGSLMKICDACGYQNAVHTMGTANLCHLCKVLVDLEAAELREKKKPVNPLYIAKKILRNNHSVGDYLLRDIPIELWLRVKNETSKNNQTIRNVILKALYTYLQ